MGLKGLMSGMGMNLFALLGLVLFFGSFVAIVVGTDSGIPMKFHCQSTWNELDVWVNEVGIPAQETIRAATYWPAKMMKVSDRWGTVTPGKYADIIEH